MHHLNLKYKRFPLVAKLTSSLSLYPFLILRVRGEAITVDIAFAIVSIFSAFGEDWIRRSGGKWHLLDSRDWDRWNLPRSYLQSTEHTSSRNLRSLHIAFLCQYKENIEDETWTPNMVSDGCRFSSAHSVCCPCSKLVASVISLQVTSAL